jgi:hypothetical protein
MQKVYTKFKNCSEFQFRNVIERDFVECFLVSFDRSEVCTHVESLRLLLKNLFHVDLFLFLRLGVVSYACEWSWAIRISAASVVAPYKDPTTGPGIMQMLFWRKILKMEKCPIVRGSCSPGLRIFTIVSGALINFQCKTNRKISCLAPD